MFIKLIDLDGPINERPSNDLSPGISLSICWELQEQTPIHGLTNNKYVTGQVSREVNQYESRGQIMGHVRPCKGI